VNKEKQIDLAENAMARASQEEEVSINIPDNWQEQVMGSIRTENSAEDIILEITENNLLRFSWVAAGIAAAVTVAFTLLYTPEQYDIEEGFESQYVEYSATELILDELK
jgi:hypothetical protein